MTTNPREVAALRATITVFAVLSMALIIYVVGWFIVHYTEYTFVVLGILSLAIIWSGVYMFELDSLRAPGNHDD